MKRYTWWTFMTIWLIVLMLSGCFQKTPLPDEPPIDQPQTATGAMEEPTEELPGAIPAEASLRYVIYEDGGVTGELIWCNDSLVPVSVFVPPYSSRAEVMDHLYMALINAEGQTGILETAIPDSLVVAEAVVTWGKATISLSGTLMIAWVCDHPRIQEQLTRVAWQFPEITEVEIWINGVTLADYLSLE